MKKMKFERKQAREERKPAANLSVDEVMPPPGMPEPEPVAPMAAQAPAKPKLNPIEQIGSYVRALDWGRLKATARKAVESGMLKDEQVDQAIDDALPSPEEAQGMPLHHVMAIASVATPEKRQQYFPILEMHAEHAKSLPDAERGQINDHMAVLGLLQQQPQETIA